MDRRLFLKTAVGASAALCLPGIAVASTPDLYREIMDQISYAVLPSEKLIRLYNDILRASKVKSLEVYRADHHAPPSYRCTPGEFKVVVWYKVATENHHYAHFITTTKEGRDPLEAQIKMAEYLWNYKPFG